MTLGSPCMMLSRCREVVGKARSHCRQEQPSARSDADAYNDAYNIDHSGCSERKLGVHVGVRVNVRFVLAVRTSGLAGLGAGAERLFDDALDGACTAAAFDTAAEAAIDLPG